MSPMYRAPTRCFLARLQPYEAFAFRQAGADFAALHRQISKALCRKLMTLGSPAYRPYGVID